MNDFVKVILDWPFITTSSAVFASATEVGEDGKAFLGLAPYTVCNVVPEDSSVTILVKIEWPGPILLRLDCLAICTGGAACR
ncbi:hypothetical protein [Gloeocapsa sp. PCC 73106]|uniref:hypothetical protein n=1 Tax=Gloeocapsa sp. PCC 73106 TaxID=102232 RepID=UPI0002AD0BAE|nr:hypothetical protein [Gloeocapsa sp. PCC 73106]ELS00166.1 hypothetical protein GLO73106DRAFT_00040210 [Gloeocapsa sp. PCC 73106]